MTRRKALFTLGIAVFLFANTYENAAFAQDNWRIASAAPATGILREHHERIAAIIGAKSNGAVISTFQYVGGEGEALQQIARGRLKGGVISMIALAAVTPEAGVLLTPYLWASEAEAEWVIAEKAGPRLAELLAEKGLTLVGYAAGGWTNVVGKEPFLTPANVINRKIRASPAPASQFFWSAVGANPVQLPIGEVFSALELGVVEGADMPFTFYVSSPAAVLAPNYVLTRHAYNFSAVVVNSKAWNSLNTAAQQNIRDNLPTLHQLNEEFAQAETPLAETFKSTGGKIWDLSKEQKALWFDAVSAGQAAFVAKAGEAAVAYYNFIQKARAEFAAR
ncbi:TRAP transporter substrate-binding protein [Chelatococcus asaccharovorans]|uniref:TRAP-type C4-dicarboxylate transport system substrate-binding protein n=1 Tax=Chelatococcus asaccharovorans TaxID=28210 RepID=A0A2V3UHI7_9HYPH|nr:TRAP transporter substrate-binding protein DctP [Chelatococcus asaccharovorans]MBS7706601.1 TRAP transporter substrate-binding protein [Chelatococcus asaccharovorans]PXW64751.1 TRAP-type C4-dicarboxylate transport system substrate-binding protein [Chelatococcus asaccharovorans]